MATLRRLAVVVLLGFALAGCQKNSPAPPPPPTTPGGGGTTGETITGRERIGWDQQASSPSELATFKYAIYLDGGRADMADVTCSDTSGSDGFTCSGRLPTMTSGAHTLELATYITSSGGVVESARSGALRVTVQASTAASSASAAYTAGPAGVTRDGTALAVERLAEGLIDPVDLAVAPDGRVFVAERSGQVRIAVAGRADAAAVSAVDVDGGELVALALDAAFARTHFVYALYAAPTRDGRTYRVSRLREVNGTLGERAVLLNAIAPATVPAAAVLRVSPDGRLIVGIGNASAARAPFEGKLLRFTADGSTPPDQNGTPAIAGGLEQPRSAAWDPARTAVWTLDRGAGGEILASVVLAAGQPAQIGTVVRIPEPGATSVAMYEGSSLTGFEQNLLLASPEGKYILRLRPLGAGRSRAFASERLLEDRVGPVRLVAASPDGSIYFTTADALGRIVLQR